MERHRGTIALALLIIGLFGWLKADISGLRGEIWELGNRIGQVEQRVARIEGALFRDPVATAELHPDD